MCAPWSAADEALPQHPRRRGLRAALCARDFKTIARVVHCRAASSPPEKKEKHKADRNCLSSRPRLKAHTRGHPCRECWRQAYRARLLIRRAPGACQQQGTSQPHPSHVSCSGCHSSSSGPTPPWRLSTVAYLPFRLPLLAPIVISISMPAPVRGGGKVSDAGVGESRGDAPSGSDI